MALNPSLPEEAKKALKLQQEHISFTTKSSNQSPPRLQICEISNPQTLEQRITPVQATLPRSPKILSDSSHFNGSRSGQIDTLQTDPNSGKSLLKNDRHKKIHDSLSIFVNGTPKLDVTPVGSNNRKISTSQGHLDNDGLPSGIKKGPPRLSYSKY